MAGRPRSKGRPRHHTPHTAHHRDHKDHRDHRDHIDHRDDAQTTRRPHGDHAQTTQRPHGDHTPRPHTDRTELDAAFRVSKFLQAEALSYIPELSASILANDKKGSGSPSHTRFRPGPLKVLRAFARKEHKQDHREEGICVQSVHMRSGQLTLVQASCTYAPACCRGNNGVDYYVNGTCEVCNVDCPALILGAASWDNGRRIV